MQETFINLIRVEFPTPLLLADHGHDITFNEQVYRADSTLLSDIGDVTEENTINTTTFDLTLTATPELQAYNRSGAWLNLPVYYYRAWYDGGLQKDVELLFRGRLISQEESDGEAEKSIRFECSSHFLDWQSTAGRTTNTSSQKLHKASDRGFEHAGKERDDIKWGRK